MTLRDVQATSDNRELSLDRVGISGLRYPVAVSDRDGTKQQTVGDITMSAFLPAEVKGAHLSRFVEVFDQHASEIGVHTLPSIARALQQRLDTIQAQITVRATYFRDRHAPVTGRRSVMGYEVLWSASSEETAESLELGVRVPVTSVCPCSKAISDYGAHNQRGHIAIQARLAQPNDDAESRLWLEDLIDLAESSSSAPLYPLLKRPDERHVTMQAYDNPVFVEDMVRAVATQLKEDPRLTAFRVDAVNDESIHDHAAFAEIEWPTPGTFGRGGWTQ